MDAKIVKATTKNKHTYTKLFEAFNKELGKQILRPLM